MNRFLSSKFSLSIIATTFRSLYLYKEILENGEGGGGGQRGTMYMKLFACYHQTSKFIMLFFLFFFSSFEQNALSFRCGQFSLVWPSFPPPWMCTCHPPSHHPPGKSIPRQCPHMIIYHVVNQVFMPPATSYRKEINCSACHRTQFLVSCVNS